MVQELWVQLCFLTKQVLTRGGTKTSRISLSDPFFVSPASIFLMIKRRCSFYSRKIIHNVIQGSDWHFFLFGTNQLSFRFEKALATVSTFNNVLIGSVLATCLSRCPLCSMETRMGGQFQKVVEGGRFPSLQLSLAMEGTQADHLQLRHLSQVLGSREGCQRCLVHSSYVGKSQIRINRYHV